MEDNIMNALLNSIERIKKEKRNGFRLYWQNWTRTWNEWPKWTG